MIIASVNSKGGVGKSTLSGNLAVWIHEHGKRVAFADCDTQSSCSEWLTESFPDISVVRLATSDEIVDELPVLAEEFDYVVADGPGSQNDVSRSLLLRADLAIIPAKASHFEARALAKNTAFLRHALDIRHGEPKAIAVLSMVGQRFRLTRQMREVAASLGLQMAATSISLRQAYADAPGQGTVVWRMGHEEKAAAIEIHTLFCELLPEIPKGSRLSLRALIDQPVQRRVNQSL